MQGTDAPTTPPQTTRGYLPTTHGVEAAAGAFGGRGVGVGGKPRVLDLFSGIGGFSLGLERAGMQTVAFCEIDPFARRVLAKHWPEVPCHDDIRTLSADWLAENGLWPDVICGGFPCQDISLAGKGAGIGGERSGLWREYARLIGEIRPRYVIVENVAALLGRGLGDVLGDLAALGYDAEWHCIPAAAVGAPHQRDRIWIVAYPAWDGAGRPWIGTEHGGACVSRPVGQQAVKGQDAAVNVAYASGIRCGTRRPQQSLSGTGPYGEMAHPDSRGWGVQGHVGETLRDTRAGQSGDGGSGLAYAQYGNAPDWNAEPSGERSPCTGPTGSCSGSRAGEIRVPGLPRLEIRPGTLREWAHAATTGTGWWATEPDVGRVVDGPAGKVDRRQRLIALGNAVVPQIPELIGRAIMASWI